jgi:hypothetical protein
MSENNGVKYAGTKIRLGDHEYVLPSLSVKQAKKLWPQIIKINEGITTENLPERYDIIVETIHAALSRNYPDLKIEDLQDVVDMGNIRYLQLAIMGQSGMDMPEGLKPVAETKVVM